MNWRGARGALVLAVALFGLSSSSASAAKRVDVFVGYADTLHANPANYPAPWDGSPGVIFRGCHGASCVFDASAIRIANNTPVPQQIKSLTVTIGSCRLRLWPGTTKLAPGQQLIVTQTAANPTGGCHPNTGSIDGSELGASGACLQSGGPIPRVSLSINGTSTTLFDTARVLSAGGRDPGCAGHNESNQWTRIGTSRCQGAILRLYPRRQRRRVGRRAVLGAKLTNGCGVGLQGVRFALVVFKGPDKKRLWLRVTNPRGIAVLRYRGHHRGLDRVIAGLRNPGGTIFSNRVKVRWRARKRR